MTDGPPKWTDGPPIWTDSRYIGTRATDTKATWHPHGLSKP